MPLASKRLAGRSRSCAMVFTPRCYWPRRTDDSYQDIVAAGANGLGPSALPQPTTTLSCSVLTAKFFPPTSLGLDRARPTGAFKSSVTRMHGKAARPGKTIGFLSRENYYFPRPQSLSILPNSISSFTLRASLKAFGQSSSSSIFRILMLVDLRFFACRWYLPPRSTRGLAEAEPHAKDTFHASRPPWATASRGCARRCSARSRSAALAASSA